MGESLFAFRGLIVQAITKQLGEHPMSYPNFDERPFDRHPNAIPFSRANYREMFSAWALVGLSLMALASCWLG